MWFNSETTDFIYDGRYKRSQEIYNETVKKINEYELD